MHKTTPAVRHPRHVASIYPLRVLAQNAETGRLHWHGGPPSYRNVGVVVDAAAAGALVEYHDSLAPANQRLLAGMIEGGKGRFLAAVALAARKTGRRITVS
jgi:hypothetical protein